MFKPIDRREAASKAGSCRARFGGPRIVCAICQRGPLDGQALHRAGPAMYVCVGGHAKDERRAALGLNLK